MSSMEVVEYLIGLYYLTNKSDHSQLSPKMRPPLKQEKEVA